MNKILLVGNGLTAKLIPAYSNQSMMRKVKEEFPDLWNKANELFEPFRLNVDSVLHKVVAAGFCGRKFCGETEINGPILGVAYNKKLLLHIRETLDSLNFGDAQRLSEELFQINGLINETQKSAISNLESLLKVIELFYAKGEFLEEDRAEITEAANRIYFNDGECGESALPDMLVDHLKRWLSSYDMIFTTNFDCVLDEVLQTDEIRHLHGGFFYRDQDRFRRSSTIVSPEEACLIWGISGEEKKREMKAGGGFEFPFSGEIEFRMTIFESYLSELQAVEAERIDIFGYSGENDQHINAAIARNASIREIHYYCKPDVILDKASKDYKNFQIKSQFHIEPPKKLVLESWDEVWRIINDR